MKHGFVTSTRAGNSWGSSRVSHGNETTVLFFGGTANKPQVQKSRSPSKTSPSFKTSHKFCSDPNSLERQVAVTESGAAEEALIGSPKKSTG